MMRCACCCLSADVPIQLELHKVSGSHVAASSSFNIPVVAFLSHSLPQDVLRQLRVRVKFSAADTPQK